MRNKRCACHFSTEDTVDSLRNRVELLQEDIECVHMWLDDQGAPREGEEGTLSIVGRIMRLSCYKPPPPPEDEKGVVTWPDGRQTFGHRGRPVTGYCETCGAPTCESMGIDMCTEDWNH